MTERSNWKKIAPDGMKAFGGVHSYISQCGLDHELLNLVNLRTSQINGCAYCIDQHSRDLLKGGLSTDKLVLVPVWHEAGDLFSEKERAALALAESVTRVSETGIPDAEYKAAALLFTEKELVDLVLAIGLMNAYNRIGVGFRLKPAGVP